MELVERDATLRLLEARLLEVALGAGHTALIGGEAGVGKTTLLKALAQRQPDVSAADPFDDAAKRADIVKFLESIDVTTTPFPIP